MEAAAIESDLESPLTTHSATQGNFGSWFPSTSAKSGNFGNVACFSTQTYKHMNSGEGGFLTTNDVDIAAQAIVLSGSYMLYENAMVRRHPLRCLKVYA